MFSQAHSHGIRGHVYIVDKNNLYIRKFSYDGGGSLDAYFWVSYLYAFHIFLRIFDIFYILSIIVKLG